MINYSFITPHKNSPELLMRYIDSIPERDDIEIIVVDDNSDDDKKPVINRMNLKVICLDASQSNGAGHARNVGLEYATGQWVLFADSDDTYSETLLPTLDEIKDGKDDVVYFNHVVIRGNKITENRFCEKGQQLSEEDCFKIRYGRTVPWNKAVRLDFLKKYNIQFEECPVGNDILFAYQVAYLTKENYRIVDLPLYNYYINPGSINHRKKNNEAYYLTICKHIYQRNAFYRFLGKGDKTRTMLSKFAAILIKKGWSQFVLCFKVYMTQKEEIERDRSYFIDVIKSRESNG